MSAKEMFEELGYDLEIDNEKELLYVKTINSSIGNFYYRIWFYRNDKIIDFVKKTNEIDMKLLQAINEQVSELGWNNE